MVAAVPWRAVGLGALMIVSGVGNFMSFWAMGQKISGYPMMLLYTYNGMYALVFLFLLVSRELFATIRMARLNPEVTVISAKAIGQGGEKAGALGAHAGTLDPLPVRLCGNRKQHRFYLVMGLATGLSLELQQLANGKVNPDMQSILYQLYLPFTAMVSSLYLRKRFGKWEILGGVLVLGGAIAVVVPAGVTEGNRLVWAFVYGLGALPLAMACVLQEEVFRQVDPTSVLQMSFWSTFYGILFNIATLPVAMIPNMVYEDGPVFPHGASFPTLMEHQADGFRCLFGRQPLPHGCSPGAWLPVVECALSYGVNVYACMALVREVSAVTAVLIGSLLVPGTAIASAVPALLGLFGIGASQVMPVTWYVILGGLLCVSGIIAYHGDAFFGSAKTKAKGASCGDNDGNEDTDAGTSCSESSQESVQV
eukprot:CAMPEP_0198497982 /NCGR_PEP_ID=MMETSP1462-20131121/6728_1 /TAXON_ID=1333877 /ORGANISM="Brandtodinium nutriculum, Strain RCC3387" /LENGTH=422 /DNA_ID=CAMNT_0044226875 /DNA_START=57 /DNA_END=1325 /DNA_ORIENTATION=+